MVEWHRPCRCPHFGTLQRQQLFVCYIAAHACKALRQAFRALKEFVFPGELRQGSRAMRSSRANRCMFVQARRLARHPCIGRSPRPGNPLKTGCHSGLPLPLQRRLDTHSFNRRRARSPLDTRDPELGRSRRFAQQTAILNRRGLRQPSFYPTWQDGCVRQIAAYRRTLPLPAPNVEKSSSRARISGLVGTAWGNSA